VQSQYEGLPGDKGGGNERQGDGIYGMDKDDIGAGLPDAMYVESGA